MNIQSNVSSRQRPDVPATFESLNDDTLTTTLQFVGDKSYRTFGGINKRCREIYLSSGMTKKTFLYGYVPLSRIINKIERVIEGKDWKLKLFERVAKGVVLYNRRDVFEWALQERKDRVLRGICNVAGGEGRFDILKEVWNNVNEDENDKRFVYRDVYGYAARGGKLEVLKWVESKGLDINNYGCAIYAARGGHIHILQWLKEEKGFELGGDLYYDAIRGGHLHVMKWLREKEVPFCENTFKNAAKEGNLDILQWLHDEGCPWDPNIQIGGRLKPEVVNWCRANGYSHRIIIGR